MGSKKKIVFLFLHIFCNFWALAALSREKDLTKREVDRMMKDPFGHLKEGSLVAKYLSDFVTPTKYIAYALGYYNVTVSLESRVGALLEVDYSSSLTTSTSHVLVELTKIIQKLQAVQDEPGEDYHELEEEAVRKFLSLTDAIYQQYDEAKTLVENDFRSINSELKIWLDSQRKYLDNWKNMIKHGITLYEKGDDDEEVQERIMKVDTETVLSTIQSLTGIYEAYLEVDRLVRKLEGKIAADKESGVFHKNYDNAYISILKLDQALFGMVQEKNNTLSKFKKVTDAARNRMKSLVEEHDLKYVNTLQDIDILSQKISNAEKTFQKYLKHKNLSNFRSDDEYEEEEEEEEEEETEEEEDEVASEEPVFENQDRLEL